MNRLWLTFAGANQRQRADLSAALGLGKRPVTLRRSGSGVFVTGIGDTWASGDGSQTPANGS